MPDEKCRHPKLASHAANPLPVCLDGDVYRIFYSGRDDKNRSSVGAVDIDIVSRTVVEQHFNPFFTHGVEGSFYQDGVSIGDCYTVDGVAYMLFMGWQSLAGQHWRGDIGRLILKQDLTLHLDSPTPLMASDHVDPVSLSYPYVMHLNEKNYGMWYGSTKTWDAGNGEMLHVINFASSSDGHHWERKGAAVPFQLGVAQAFSKPSVIKNSDNDFEMWFSYRSGAGQSYRIGYAKSENGLDWRLQLEKAGISPSAQGWDSEMIEYPYVFDHKGVRHMLYNGNGYGISGFGLAVLC